MYAIIRSGGKQSKVSAGDVIDVELLKDDSGRVTFTPLLVVDGEGRAVTDRARLEELPVTAQVEGEVRGPKLDIFKYKNKSGYRRRMGHRQRYTRLRIVGIGPAGESAGEEEDRTGEDVDMDDLDIDQGNGQVGDQGNDRDDNQDQEE